MRLVIEGDTLEDIEGQLIDALSYLNKGGSPINAHQPFISPDRRVVSADEPPLPDAPPPDLFQEAQRVFAVNGECPIHHKPWKTVPAGVSKKTGKPYNSFQACPERDCSERPAA